MLPCDERNAIDEAHGMSALRRVFDRAAGAGLLAPGFDGEALLRLPSGAIHDGVDGAVAGEPAAGRLSRGRLAFSALLRYLRP